ncbi:hypothetical protein D3C73_1404130 [compost metagenome]
MIAEREGVSFKLFSCAKCAECLGRDSQLVCDGQQGLTLLFSQFRGGQCALVVGVQLLVVALGLLQRKLQVADLFRVIRLLNSLAFVNALNSAID